MGTYCMPFSILGLCVLGVCLLGCCYAGAIARRNDEDSDESESEGVYDDDVGDMDVLPEGWEEHQMDDGNVYYYNALTQQTSWTAPPTPLPPPPPPPPAGTPLPDGWAEYMDEGGATYFYNTLTMETTWNRPSPPAGAGEIAGEIKLTIMEEEDGQRKCTLTDRHNKAAQKAGGSADRGRTGAMRHGVARSGKADGDDDAAAVVCCCCADEAVHTAAEERRKARAAKERARWEKRSCLMRVLCLPFDAFVGTTRRVCTLLRRACRLLCCPCRLCYQAVAAGGKVYCAPCILCCECVAMPFVCVWRAMYRALRCIVYVALCECLWRKRKPAEHKGRAKGEAAAKSDTRNGPKGRAKGRGGETRRPNGAKKAPPPLKGGNKGGARRHQSSSFEMESCSSMSMVSSEESDEYQYDRGRKGRHHDGHRDRKGCG